MYFNWPGFFPALATFIEATGLPPLQVAAWAPVANIALWSLGVAAALRALTRDKDAIVLPLWLFLIGNWIDQDYLSPQALGFLLHLAVLALVLRVLGATVQGGDRASATTGASAPGCPSTRTGSCDAGPWGWCCC